MGVASARAPNITYTPSAFRQRRRSKLSTGRERERLTDRRVRGIRRAMFTFARVYVSRTHALTYNNNNKISIWKDAR